MTLRFENVSSLSEMALVPAHTSNAARICFSHHLGSTAEEHRRAYRQATR